MKILLLLFLGATLVSCNKSESVDTAALEQKRVDSINQQRAKYNDSIKILNSTNRFEDLTGSASLAFESDQTKFKGPVQFTKTGRDTYSVEGKIANNKNEISISGTAKRVSDRHINFEGIINQTIDGQSSNRNKKMTFFDESQNQKFRLQDKVGAQGFVEYFDLSFN